MKRTRTHLWVLFAAVVTVICFIFFGCTDGLSEESAGKESEIIAESTCTGYFLKTESDFFFIAAEEDETFYKGEPVKISPPSWDENTTVNFDGFGNGDRIEVTILQVEDSKPRSMPVYEIKLIEEGTPDNIGVDTIQYLAELGYTVMGDD